jgi:uncharacterized protein YbjT (DUF2867 family)
METCLFELVTVHQQFSVQSFLFPAAGRACRWRFWAVGIVRSSPTQGAILQFQFFGIRLHPERKIMNIVVTGSLGSISKPLTSQLVENGHSVTVISSNPQRQKEIEAAGARAAIGTMADASFLAAAFTGADAAYCMISTGSSFSDRNLDLMAYPSQIAHNYKHAIQQSAVKRMVFLSSVGAHSAEGNGTLALYYHVENILKELPSDVAITFMRPVGFYYNLLAFIPAIKTRGFIASNYGGGDKKPWVSPIDIAAAVAEEITGRLEGRNVRYVASDDLTCKETAGILGAAIGQPDLQWLVIPGEQVLNGMVAAGMNPRIAAGLVEMNAVTHSGKLYEDYYLNEPVLGKVKMQDYAADFARAYHQEKFLGR